MSSAENPPGIPGPDLPEIRPLVIHSSPATDGTLIGLIASATAANVLGRTDLIINEVGLDLTRPGMVGLLCEPLLERLAAKVGCAARDLGHLVHPYIEAIGTTDGPKNASYNSSVRWGSGAMQRHHLILDRRRVAPTTLLKSGHHRWQWLCALLPYCPDSLERLVDDCQACGALLGWSRAYGISRCETCREILAPSPEEPFPGPFSEDYRRFARLLSPVPGEREQVLEGLHRDLRNLHPTSIAPFVIRIGCLVRGLPAETWAFSHALLAPADLADAVSVGMGLLSEWPIVFRGRISTVVRGVTGDERADILMRIRKLGDRNAPSDIAALMHAAIPEAFEMTQRALALEEPTMLSCDICRMTGIDVDDVRHLEEGGVLTPIETRVGERRHVQYLRREVEDFAARKKGSQRATVMAEALGLPRYAIEQTLGAGEVEREIHRGVLLLDDSLRLVKSSVEDFFRDINARARSDEAPERTIPLWNASRTVGGQLKNWGALLSRLRNGQTDFWLIPDESRSLARHSKLVRRILVMPEDVIPVLRSRIDVDAFAALPIADVMSQVDAAEVLNIDAVQMKRVVDAGDLSFEASGKALWVRCEAVLALATKYIAVPELAYTVGAYGPGLTRRLYKRLDISRSSVGWLRTDIERERASLATGDAWSVKTWRRSGAKFDVTARSRKRVGWRVSRPQ